MRLGIRAPPNAGCASQGRRASPHRTQPERALEPVTPPHVASPRARAMPRAHRPPVTAHAPPQRSAPCPCPVPSRRRCEAPTRRLLPYKRPCSASSREHARRRTPLPLPSSSSSLRSLTASSNHLSLIPRAQSSSSTHAWPSCPYIPPEFLAATALPPLPRQRRSSKIFPTKLPSPIDTQRAYMPPCALVCPDWPAIAAGEPPLRRQGHPCED
jgi:hypothetical protein